MRITQAQLRKIIKEEAACEELGTKIEELVMQIEDDLYNGDYVDYGV
jgi:hypothetical protein